MEYVVLAAVVVGALVIGVDSVRQRRRLRRRPDARRALATRIQVAGPGSDALVGTRELRRLLRGEEVSTPPLDREPPRGPGETALGGIWDQLADILDPDTFRPHLAEGSEVKIFRLRWGNDYAMLASPERTDHFRIEPWEAEVVLRMDGTRTVSELVVERLREDGDLDAGAVLSLVLMLRNERMLEPRTLNLTSLLREQLDPASPGRKRLREFGRNLRLEWSGAERFTRAAYRAGLRVAFRPVGAAVVAVVALGGAAAFVAVVSSGRFELRLQAAPTEAAILLGLGFFVTFVHELGHALALVHYERRVLSAGFFVFFGSPAFFVDASDVLMLDGRRRIMQSAAGPLAEAFVAGITAIVLLLAPDLSFGTLLYRFAFVNYFLLLENLVPLLELDGYWILADLIQVPDLRPRSLAFVRSDLWHKLRIRERFRPQEIGLALYGIVGSIFTVFAFYVGIFFWKQLFGSIVVELWQGGLGSRILLLVLAAFFAGPIIRGLIRVGRAIRGRVQGYVAEIRFRRERSWRIEAASLIDNLPAFEDLPEDLLSSLAGRVRLRSLASGHPVFRQGDRPRAFYILRSGTVRVEDEDPQSGDTRVLRTMGRGEAFGELGLLGSAPRQATVRASTDVQLFEVDKGTFDRLLIEGISAPDFEPTLQSLVELRALGPFKRLSTEELAQIVERGAWVLHAPGDVVIEQGEPGDAFFAIASGRADVQSDGLSLNELGPGDHFGELALLDDAPRSASVIARTPMRTFRLDREGFDRVLARTFRRGLGARTNRSLEH